VQTNLYACQISSIDSTVQPGARMFWASAQSGHMHIRAWCSDTAARCSSLMNRGHRHGSTGHFHFQRDTILNVITPVEHCMLEISTAYHPPAPGEGPLGPVYCAGLKAPVADIERV
jgi:hypothetical protein